MRAVLITNPNATTSIGWSRDILVRSIQAEFENLEIVNTEHRGHASEIAKAARATGVDIVFTLGGDGTVNETINGLLAPSSNPCPLLATIPGGLANVFARSIGIAPDAMTATGQLLDAWRGRNTREISLGLMNQRWFSFNAGVGLDAAVVQAVEASRAEGNRASAGLYVVSAIRELFENLGDDRPHLQVHCTNAEGEHQVARAYMVIVQNTTPWTYAGPLPLDFAPASSFDGGLDVVALTSVSPSAVAALFAEGAARLPAGRRTSSELIENCSAVTITADRPLPAQVDGDAIGEITSASFSKQRHALRVLVPFD